MKTISNRFVGALIVVLTLIAGVAALAIASFFMITFTRFIYGGMDCQSVYEKEMYLRWFLSVLPSLGYLLNNLSIILLLAAVISLIFGLVYLFSGRLTHGFLLSVESFLFFWALALGFGIFLRPCQDKEYSLLAFEVADNLLPAIMSGLALFFFFFSLCKIVPAILEMLLPKENKILPPK
jgi:exosortase/archaeosortase